MGDSQARRSSKVYVEKEELVSFPRKTRGRNASVSSAGVRRTWREGGRTGDDKIVINQRENTNKVGRYNQWDDEIQDDRDNRERCGLGG